MPVATYETLNGEQRVFLSTYLPAEVAALVEYESALQKTTICRMLRKIVCDWARGRIESVREF